MRRGRKLRIYWPPSKPRRHVRVDSDTLEEIDNLAHDLRTLWMLDGTSGQAGERPLGGRLTASTTVRTAVLLARNVVRDMLDKIQRECSR